MRWLCKSSLPGNILLQCACISASILGAAAQQPYSRPTLVPRTAQRAAPRAENSLLADLNSSCQDLASRVSPAVVQIEVSGFAASDDGGRKGSALIVRQHAIGSGVIVDPEGFIMTNAHVIEGAQRVRILMTASPSDAFDVSSAGKTRTFDAKVLGVQKEADLALLKVDGHNLPTLKFNLERDPRPGELVFAIGSPEGLQNSITMGVISSVWRQPDPDSAMVYLQTDAPINPGNSGGPLVDINGTVLGLNTFIYSNGGGNEGLGFAIPAGIVNFVYQSLRKHGHVDHVEIGAQAQTITPTMAEGLRLSRNWGVMISDVSFRGPADAAGIKPEDIILSVDGHPTMSLHGFAAALYQHSLDEVVKIEILRGNRKMTFDVPAVRAREGLNNFDGMADPVQNHIDALGILGMDINNDVRALIPDLRISGGVVVVGRAPGLNSINNGLRAGDVIHSINRTTIASVEQLKSALAELKSGDAAVLRIERQGQLQYLAFEME